MPLSGFRKDKEDRERRSSKTDDQSKPKNDKKVEEEPFKEQIDNPTESQPRSSLLSKLIFIKF
jgi:hypothetical protein